MKGSDRSIAGLELSGLDGANPLGFLAALGTVATLAAAGERAAKLFWVRRGNWRPVIAGPSIPTPEALAEVLAQSLQGKDVPADAEERRKVAQQEVDDAKTGVKKKQEEIRKRRLSRKERLEAEQTELDPLQTDYERKREDWLRALADAVPLPELALGKRIDCTDEEYRQFAAGSLDAANHSRRDAVDMLAGFGTDAARKKNSESIEPTPFCFISGGGHQDFLDTVRQLIDRVSVDRIREALFRPWSYRDERLSMRWDPVEDRRYALLDTDPGPEGARTVWMANLLAYRALALFPCSPGRRGLATAGWATIQTELTFTWPIWIVPITVETIRSLLQLDDLTAAQPDRVGLQARGIATLYRARRVRIPPTGSNYKLNFNVATAV